MTKTEFLEVISRECGFLPPYKRRIVMSHFNALLAECDLTDVTEQQGMPQNALRQYLNTSKTYSKIPVPLFAAALAILSPFIVNLVIVAALLALVLIVFAIALSAIVPVFGIALWLDGMEIIISSLPMKVMLVDKLAQISIGLMYFGGGIIILLLIYKLYSKLAPKLLKCFVALHERLEKRSAK